MAHILKRVEEQFAQPAVPKFGVSKNQCEEEACKFVHVFMRRLGRTDYRTLRHAFLPTKTLRDVKEVFEKKHGEGDQQHIVDENGFVFSEKMLDEPLWKFSHCCRLNVDFTYDNNLTTVKDATSSAMKIAAETTNTVVRSVRGRFDQKANL